MQSLQTKNYLVLIHSKYDCKHHYTLYITVLYLIGLIETKLFRRGFETQELKDNAPGHS
jgi:hypothetical protein